MSINALYTDIRNGNTALEGQLFQLLYERFMQFANRRIWDEREVEDVVQSALAVIATEYKVIDITSSFSAWAYKVLDNKILSFIKIQRNQKKSTVPISESIPARDLNDVIDPDFRNQLLHCLKLINSVYKRHARILNLHYQGYTTEEICKKMRVSRNNLYIILFRARSMLEKCLNTGDIGS